MSQGSLFVISAPSGAGKTTLLKMVLAAVPKLVFSISHTTRSRRPDEIDGRDYHFVSREEFLRLRAEGGFLEWAEVHGNLYGTGRVQVEHELAQGVDILLDIDVQGARQIREAKVDNTRLLFIAPPDMAELERRLIGRGTDQAAVIALRLANARREMASMDLYDFVVVNDKRERAADTIRAIIIAERSRTRRDADGQPINLASHDRC
jgi:guanylate kinase